MNKSRIMDVNYQPFGPEWTKEVKKMKKDEIIALLAKNSKARIELLKVLTNLLAKCPLTLDSRNERDAAHALIDKHRGIAKVLVHFSDTNN